MPQSSTVQPIVATVRDACQLLNLSKSTIHNLVNAGTLKSTLVGRRRLILRSSIDALFENAA